MIGPPKDQIRGEIEQWGRIEPGIISPYRRAIASDAASAASRGTSSTMDITHAVWGVAHDGSPL